MSEEPREIAVLEECLESVIDYRGKTPPKSPSGIPAITAANIKSGRINMSTVSYVSEETYRAWTSRGFPQAGDVLITTEAPVGEVAPFPGDQTYLITRRVFAMRGKKSVLDSNYLLYTCLSPVVQDELASRIRGSTVPRVLKTDILGLRIPLPPLPEQRAIAHVLGTLDDKIELNRKTNETLEAMARALFQSWFVDFDPVRAKAEGRPTELPDAISELFPDSFEESELGEIPKGWRNNEIQNVADLNPDNWCSGNQPLRIRYLDLSSVKQGRIDNLEEYEWEDAPSRARRILKAGDTVVGTVRPGNGSYCLVGEDGITGSTGFAVLRPKSMNDSAFVYLATCSKENIDRLAHLADGGAYPAVKPEVVAQTPVVIATRQVLDCFSTYAFPLFTSAGRAEQETIVLCKIRDALLPKLISGELRIPEAEKLLEQAGV